MSLKKNLESLDTITGGKKSGTAMKKGPTAMIITIAKNDTTKAEETAAVEERKLHSVFPRQGQRPLDK